MNIQEYKKQIEEGCGKNRGNSYQRRYFCGKTKYKHENIKGVIYYCDSCIVKLEAIEQCEKIYEYQISEADKTISFLTKQINELNETHISKKIIDEAIEHEFSKEVCEQNRECLEHKKELRKVIFRGENEK